MEEKICFLNVTYFSKKFEENVKYYVLFLHFAKVYIFSKKKICLSKFITIRFTTYVTFSITHSSINSTMERIEKLILKNVSN